MRTVEFLTNILILTPALKSLAKEVKTIAILYSISVIKAKLFDLQIERSLAVWSSTEFIQFE